MPVSNVGTTVGDVGVGCIRETFGSDSDVSLTLVTEFESGSCLRSIADFPIPNFTVPIFQIKPTQSGSTHPAVPESVKDEMRNCGPVKLYQVIADALRSLREDRDISRLVL